jgi:hypothetical protein
MDMDRYTQKYIDGFMDDLTSRNPNEKEFVKYIRKLFPDHSGTAEL